MQSALPLDVLADELGAAAGRIERELRLKDEARAARFEARLAAIELAAFKAEEERQRIFGERLAELRDGKDGRDGTDGKDADISHLEVRYNELEVTLWDHVKGAFRSVDQRVVERLAEVKDGKDGVDGKDADIQPLWDAFNQREASVGPAFVDLEEKIDERLAQLKDGKDGEPGRDGKDADIGPLEALVEKSKDELFEQFLAVREDLNTRVAERLSEVKDGEPGPPGTPGIPGKDGKLPIAREWTNRVHYAGDVVRHGGATYQALADTGSEPPSGDWGELASRGTDGIGFVLRGTYDAAAEYKQHDIVMLNRNSFAAKYDNPGECPGDGWQLFAPSGGRGKEGPPGGRGNDGRSVSIAGLEADPDTMVLRITDSLGKTFELDLEPVAERIIEAAR